MHFPSPLLLFMLLAALCHPADAKSFLDSGVPQKDTDMSDMISVLLADEHPHPVDLREAVRDKHAVDSHAHNQAGLQAMFKSLPKNEQGNLGLPAARYALHRLFEHRHRWFVRGLHPKTKTDGSDKMHAVGKAMQVLTTFDKTGLSLPALAAIAGTLEELISREVASHLGGIYEGLGHSMQGASPGETVEKIIDSYMTIYISGADFQNSTKQDISDDNKFMTENTKDWTETTEWVKSTTLEAARAGEACPDMAQCSFTFEQATRIAKTVVEKYGFFNDRQCHQVKTKLLSIKTEEGSRTGRVTLAEFYDAGLSGAWEFNEKIDYLRSLGALDESKANDPKVIVPNYVSSWVNCLTSSTFYSVCCRNECEDYMKVMEKHVGGPTAAPDKIIRVVETQSVFNNGPPNLASLRHRLVSIADQHRGKVPIHGRLFAQWMHHAFPSTCPYPHEAGTTNPQTPDEWMTETGHSNVKASADEVQRIVNQAKDKSPENLAAKESATAPKEVEEELPWTDTEELLVVRHTAAPQARSSWLDSAIIVMEGVMVVALVCVVMWMASLRKNKSIHQKF